MQDLARNDHVPVVEALEDQAREDEVRGRRTDIDADADEADLVLLLQASPMLLKKTLPPASSDMRSLLSISLGTTSLARISLPRRPPR